MSAGCPLCGNPLPPDEVLVDLEGGLIVGGGHVTQLTKQEFALFEALWTARPRVMTKEQLLAATAGHGFDDREIKIVDVFVCKARKKLEPTGIVIDTAWGRGYRILTPRAAQLEAVSAADELREAS